MKTWGRGEKLASNLPKVFRCIGLRRKMHGEKIEWQSREDVGNLWKDVRNDLKPKLVGWSDIQPDCQRACRRDTELFASAWAVSGLYDVFVFQITNVQMIQWRAWRAAQVPILD